VETQVLFYRFWLKNQKMFKKFTEYSQNQGETGVQYLYTQYKKEEKINGT